MDQLPTKKALVRIGKAIAAGAVTDEQLDQLDALLAWCDDVQARATERLNQVLPTFEHRSGDALAARGRAKTLITLREKLVRMGGHQLPVIRDLAGLRIVGDLTLDEQDRLLPFACGALGVAPGEYKVIDRRAEPIQGYRALHADFLLEGVRVELQIRTLLQHQWAEVYERAGDRFGRVIRYEATPVSQPGASRVEASMIVELMQRASPLIAEVEGTRRLELLKAEQVIADSTTGKPVDLGAILAGAEARRQELSSILQGLGALLDQLG